MNKSPSEYSLKQRTFNNEYSFPFLPPLSPALLVGRDYNLSPVTTASLKHLPLGPAEHTLATVKAACQSLCFQVRALWYLTIMAGSWYCGGKPLWGFSEKRIGSFQRGGFCKC